MDVENSRSGRNVGTVPFISKSIVFRYKIFTNKTDFTDFLLTKTSVLYEVKGNNILSSCDLSCTALKGVLADKGNSANIGMNVYFSYNGKLNYLFCFLKVDDHMIVLRKRNNHFMICRQFEYVEEYNVIDDNCTSEFIVMIQYINSTTECFPLASMIFDDFTKSVVGDNRTALNNFLIKPFADRLKEAECKLAECELKSRQTFTKFSEDCLFLPGCTGDSALVLARYGDVWVKNFNQRLIIGIPIYNCSIRKYLAENIRLALFTPNKEQLIYSQKYFHFTMQTNEISLPGVEQLIENDVNNGKKLLNHRWKMITNGTLYPDNAAIIVTQININEYRELSHFFFDAIVLYDVVLENGETKTLQLSAGRTELSVDVLFDKRYLVFQQKNETLIDMLAVISTSKLRLYEITLDGELNASELVSILMRKLHFEMMFESHKDEEDFIGAATTQYDSKIFYNQSNEYWKGMLVHMYHASMMSAEHDNCFTCWLKVYSNEPERMESLMNVLRNRFGQYIKIQRNDLKSAEHKCELMSSLNEEVNCLEELTLSAETDDEEKIFERLMKFSEAQNQTDRCVNNIREVKLNQTNAAAIR